MKVCVSSDFHSSFTENDHRYALQFHTTLCNSSSSTDTKEIKNRTELSSGMQFKEAVMLMLMLTCNFLYTSSFIFRLFCSYFDFVVAGVVVVSVA